MGLASSQARMMLLTARKSDLEFRAQMINQRKINLGMQTQELATKYSNAMSNRTLSFAYYTAGSTGQAQTEKLTYAGLMAENGNAGSFLVTNAEGKYVGRSEADLKVAFNRLVKVGQFDLQYKYQQVDQEQIKETYAKDADGNIVTDKDNNPIVDGYYTVTTDASGKEIEQKVSKDGYLLNADGTYVPDSQKTYDDAFAKFKEQYCDMSYCQGYESGSYLSNSDYFQDALRNGALFLQQLVNVNGGEQKEYRNIAYSSVATIYDGLDTSDDDKAQAEYESKSIILSNQDKRLDLELQQIQTQHKAIETEYDSVKKVIEKNIDVTFKIFS